MTEVREEVEGDVKVFFNDYHVVGRLGGGREGERDRGGEGREGEREREGGRKKRRDRGREG